MVENVEWCSLKLFNIRNMYSYNMDKSSGFFPEEEKAKRLVNYKKRAVICDQETRRLQLLSDQKRKREKTVSDFRNVDLLCSCDDDLVEDQLEVMECSETKTKRPRLKDMFMLSEWMISLPEDFDTKWLFALCPTGKRCFVHCAKGFTSVYGKRGQRLAKFQSALPNGSQRDVSRFRYSNSEVTLLDCIWNSQKKCYFILDLLSWKGQLYTDTEMSFRAFWIKSKMEEMPNLSERSEQNIYPFIPLEYHSCDISTVSSVISEHSSFHLNEPVTDGILFYHSEAFYTSGSTPLVLWLKPFMLPEILHMSIPDYFEQMKPSSYVNMKNFILEYEERKNKKKKRHKKSGEPSQMEEGTEIVTEEVSMLELT